ncbi:hypothetical protein NMY22_g9010 [Coprinellus aureogranulatus]|nr:hypothetical protein NMY22_g9010 [Coprinellus aureogranulatus]
MSINYGYGEQETVAITDRSASDWTKDWGRALARDIIDTRIVSIDADSTVEDACEKLLSEDIACLAIRSDASGEDSANKPPYQGLFDFSDVNAFLTLAATRHTFSLDDSAPDPRHTKIIEAATAGRVPVHLVSNLSDKNPLVTLPNDADVVALLEVFARGTHRVLIQAPDHSGEPIGMVSDRGMLTWFDSYAKGSATFKQYLLNPIHTVSLPSLHLYASVVAAMSSAPLLDAMKLMSEEGVSSVAVLDDENGALLSAVSVTDVGKMVIPSQSNHILGTPLNQFISMIKAHHGWVDGADRYPVYSVMPSSTLQYTMEKLLATNSHRLFVTRESTMSSPVLSPSAVGELCGIVSVVDILALFARLANIENIDPTEMQRHRRRSSASSRANEQQTFLRSRSSSISSAAARQSPSVIACRLALFSPMGGLQGNAAAVGTSIPADTPHAISVSLPTWRDNVGYEEGEKRVVDSMVNGYPRFFIHLSIRKLASICEQKHAVGNEQAMLFPTKRIAEQCREFMRNRGVSPRLVALLICPDETVDKESIGGTCADLHIVLFPAESFPVAKEFWQHTGLGISSRLAEKCLSLLPEETKAPAPVAPSNRYSKGGFTKHYSAKKPSPPPQPPAREDGEEDSTVYLEERYGRNLPLSAATFAKRALRRRLAGVLLCDSVPECQETAGKKDLVVGPSTRGVQDVSENDVYLYPTGMSAIWSAHQLALNALTPAKSVCFGFPYTDTLKILQKWGPGCHFLGNGLDSDIDELEKILEKEPILALFTEFPSNPLLRSANLPRLRNLADKYGFIIVIDETIGSFTNVKVIQYADVVVSSLTKVFSGASNVMGGSLILNPQGSHYAALKAKQDELFEDVYFDEDAIYMERNSRDFKQRIDIIGANAEAICDYLRSRSLATNAPNAVIKEVWYPKYITAEHYEHCRVKADASPDGKPGGYGGLFSLTFTSDDASKGFFDTLSCYKGPSLGTNFTLACPFTILAHYGELDWAAQYGVEAGLVRVSVGMEDIGALLQAFKIAIDAAEAAETGST